MFLEKLQIQGFKSFANKNTLVFPGMLSESKRGITAIVGPNGSGKSNTADAVRWVLGEQSMKTLRGKKSEDIIFYGSDKKGQLSMAEVSLFLNNEDKRVAVDYSQIVLSRRLYRNGDSEYMINNNRVRLSDIQIMLAKAKFGQKTYSVIGQGMVEGFLNTSLAERKEFFDEATGVKQFQIKRDDSLNKLRSSYENLIQAQMLLTEIEPRLKSLTRQVSRLKKRGEIKGRLKEFQLVYYSKIWHGINDKFSQANRAFLELEKEKFIKDKKIEALNRELEKLEIESGQGNKFNEWQNKLNKLQSEKDGINKNLARVGAQAEIKFEANGRFDLSFLVNKKEELIKEKKDINEKIETLEKNINYDRKREDELNKEKEEIDKEINNLNNALNKISQDQDSDGIKQINNRLNKLLEKLKQLDYEQDIRKVKIALSEIKNEIKVVLQLSDKYAGNGKLNGSIADKLAKARQALNKLTQAREELMSKVNDNNLRITARSERVKLLKEKIIGMDNEIRSIDIKLKQKSDKPDFKKINDEKNALKNELSKIDDKIKIIKADINEVSAKEEEQRNKLFALQKDIQSLQNEINSLSNKLNELKINSTRYEIKLEDLEIEIRREYGNLKEIKQQKAQGEAGTEAIQEKIKQYNHQLDLIGGIDPQIEKEYVETKERYDFLSGQVNDLMHAVELLEKVIKELDVTIKKNFDKEFKVIEQKFEKYFKILFNGGRAKIIKVMDDEMAESKKRKAVRPVSLCQTGESKSVEVEAIPEQNNCNEVADVKRIKFLQKHNATGLAGIEIHATPPGKKIKSVSMLSGGERALTAIALICAIISVNPSPFVVLDEVDAALDEANSERLAKILDELSYKTQFIVITHNRATMCRANILYGVTMRDDGVSKLLSIKLDETEAGNKK